MTDSLEQDPQSIEPVEAAAVQLLQLTDCHILASPGERLLGLDTRRSFEAVSADAIANCGEIDLLLATGDLSQDGSASSYQYLAQRLEDIGIPTFWLPGNHDQGEALGAHFKGKNIHASKLIMAGAWLILMLDSTLNGEVHGRVSQDQLEFMDRALGLHPERHALVCLHHQAVDTGSQWLDLKGLRNSDQLRDRLTRHENVRAVLWGHVHQETHLTRDGIEWMSTPSTCAQFKPGSKEFAVGTEAPGYRQLRLNADGSIETRVRRVALAGLDIDYASAGY